MVRNITRAHNIVNVHVVKNRMGV